MSQARNLKPNIVRLPTAEPQGVAGRNWNRRILVVDDEPALITAYVEMLAPRPQGQAMKSSRMTRVETPENASSGDSRFDFEVTVAATAQEAIEIVWAEAAKGESFAMGFFDVRLGGNIDGVDLVKEIFEMMPSMFAVFVTAYNDRSIDSIAGTLGVSQTAQWDYMTKPFQAAEIKQKARNFVALYNLKKESDAHELERSELQRKVLESEVVSSVAAVARGVAHEFGNLLMQILGKAEISRKKSESEMREAFDRIIDASQRAHEILDRFNDLSDTKSLSTKKTWCEIEKIVDEAVDLLSHQFKKTNTRVVMIQRDSVKAFVHSTSILQVLVNIFINALHAMGNNGQIEISLKANSVFFDLDIRDYGPGVPPEILDKILEPFFTTKGEKGTGLGLAISREIIEIDHAGEFRVFNHAEKGLCIHIHIPLSQEAKNEPV